LIGKLKKRKLMSKKENKKDKILEVAALLFTERGYENTSTRDIAKAVSIASPSLYYHFKSKSDILLALLAQPMQYISNELADLPNVSKPERIRKIIEALITAFEYHNGIIMTASKHVEILDGEKFKKFESEVFGTLIKEMNTAHKELRVTMAIGAVEGAVKELNIKYQSEFAARFRLIKQQLIDIAMKILED